MLTSIKVHHPPGKRRTSSGDPLPLVISLWIPARSPLQQYRNMSELRGTIFYVRNWISQPHWELVAGKFQTREHSHVGKRKLKFFRLIRLILSRGSGRFPSSAYISSIWVLSVSCPFSYNLLAGVIATGDKSIRDWGGDWRSIVCCCWIFPFLAKSWAWMALRR